MEMEMTSPVWSDTLLSNPEWQMWAEMTSLEQNLSFELSDSIAIDDKLLQVALLSLEQGNVGPLIKEELRLTIQARRLKNGQEELVIDTSGDPTGDRDDQYELSPDDVHKRESRKEQNRRASRKYRVKQANGQKHLKQALSQLECENAHLLDEVSLLQIERQRLMAILESHLAACAWTTPT